MEKEIINKALKKSDLPKKKDTLSVEVEILYYQNNMILTENNFFDLLNNYKIIKPSDEILYNWHFSPWFNIWIVTTSGLYNFKLFMGGLGILELPDGDKGAVLVDIKKIKFDSFNINSIDEYFTVKNFNLVKNFILKNGDRHTYCNMYNNNPHYMFGFIDVFLNPEYGGPYNHPQWNINCDPDKSDFDKIVIKISSNRYEIKFDKEKKRLKLMRMQAADKINKGYVYFKQIIDIINNI